MASKREPILLQSTPAPTWTPAKHLKEHTVSVIPSLQAFRTIRRRETDGIPQCVELHTAPSSARLEPKRRRPRPPPTPRGARFSRRTRSCPPPGSRDAPRDAPRSCLVVFFRLLVGPIGSRKLVSNSSDLQEVDTQPQWRSVGHQSCSHQSNCTSFRYTLKPSLLPCA